MRVDPSSVLAGDTITVSGVGCPQGGWDPSLNWTVHVQIVGETLPVSLSPPSVVPPTGAAPHTPIAFTLEGYPGRADVQVRATPDGTWSVQLVVPGPGDSLAAVPGLYHVYALCYAAQGIEAGSVVYVGAPLTVVAALPPVVVPPNFTG